MGNECVPGCSASIRGFHGAQQQGSSTLDHGVAHGCEATRSATFPTDGCKKYVKMFSKRCEFRKHELVSKHGCNAHVRVNCTVMSIINANTKKKCHAFLALPCAVSKGLVVAKDLVWCP